MPPDREVRFVIHPGFHKTGTTSIQNWLRANQTKLGDAGVHVPGIDSGWRSSDKGIASSGNYEFAHEILDNRGLTGGDIPRSGLVILSAENISHFTNPGILIRLYLAMACRFRVSANAIAIVLTAKDPEKMLVSHYFEYLFNQPKKRYLGLYAFSVLRSMRYRVLMLELSLVRRLGGRVHVVDTKKGAVSEFVKVVNCYRNRGQDIDQPDVEPYIYRSAGVSRSQMIREKFNTSTRQIEANSRLSKILVQRSRKLLRNVVKLGRKDEGIGFEIPVATAELLALSLLNLVRYIMIFLVRMIRGSLDVVRYSACLGLRSILGFDDSKTE